MSQRITLLLSLALLPACGPTESHSGTDAVTRPISLGIKSSRTLTVMATAANGLATPRDLAFNPDVPGELWTVNRQSEGVVILHDAGAATQRTEARNDAYRYHFMSQVSSLAFGTPTNFASCHESRNEAAGAIGFMGPTLWTSDLDIFANVNQNFVKGAVCEAKAGDGPKELLGSHIDMLHQSPLCMGIAHATGNAFWVFDGDSGELVYYNFVRDHGPGYDDHSDGRLRRYTDVNLTRVAGVPSHMLVDSDSSLLYVADTGTGRVLRIDPSTASSSGRLRASSEPLAEYVAYTGASVEVFAAGLRQPSGIAIHAGQLFVSDHATGEIVVYDLATKAEVERIATGARKIMGLTVSAAGELWFVDAAANTVVRVDAE